MINLPVATKKMIIRGVKVGTSSLLALCLFVFISNYWITQRVESRIYHNIQDIEAREVGLVLGTSKSVNGRTENHFFTFRIEAAANLFFAGKIKHIIVSGDNSSQKYNEPRDMRKALIRLGVPDSCITMDFAGLRTLDSVVRCGEIFGQKKITIISQNYHNYRALFIAEHHGIDAIAFSAQDPQKASTKVWVREYLARPKAVIDLYLLDAQPKYLGDKIEIKLP